MHSPASNLTVKTSLCTGETKLSDAKSASKKQGECAHNLVRVGHVGWPGGEACEREAESDAAARSTWQGAEECGRGAESSSSHVWG